MKGWSYFLWGFFLTIAFGLFVNKAFAGTHTGEIYVQREDVTWCIYKPEEGHNDNRLYAVKFPGQVVCPERYDDEEVE